MTKSWSKEWLADVKNAAWFPLQLANCDRLEKNNAVYIFDEVGSGKTISAGLMALHYLYHNYFETRDPQARVLVITTSQLADKAGEPGPFKRLWLNKLPFSKWGFEHQITVINHDYRNIGNVNDRIFVRTRNGFVRDEDNWDLVIIDEAHLFLNSNPNKHTRRYRELIGESGASGKISAKKVVFLTATPIRKDWKDLQAYSQIARWMTHSGGRNVNCKCYTCFNNPASLRPVSPEKLICAAFDPELPFTRYFKDTIRALNLCDSQKLFPKRRLARVWMCRRENRLETALEKINALYETAPDKNRFVIFVRWVKKNIIDPGCSADELEAYFLEHGFAKWNGSRGEKSVEVVTGANHKSLSAYCDPDPGGLPTVLIINYQIGEQGVNLPGYNHVINYHIPASPASLEQRFGRIDRLDSTSKEIHIYFPLLESHCDSSTINFYLAVSTYLKQQLPVLPARNSILTEEILDVYEKYSKDMLEQAGEIRNICKQWKSDAPWTRILNYLDGRNSWNETAGNGLEQTERTVAEFIIGAEKTIDADIPVPERIKRLKTICGDRLDEILAASVSQERIETTREMIGQMDHEIGNLIFYYADLLPAGMSREEILRNLKTIHPGGDGCAGLIQHISEYKEYFEKLKDFSRALPQEESK